jgi:hypothetical protein
MLDRAFLRNTVVIPIDSVSHSHKLQTSKVVILPDIARQALPRSNKISCWHAAGRNKS